VDAAHRRAGCAGIERPVRGSPRRVRACPDPRRAGRQALGRGRLFVALSPPLRGERPWAWPVAAGRACQQDSARGRRDRHVPGSRRGGSSWDAVLALPRPERRGSRGQRRRRPRVPRGGARSTHWLRLLAGGVAGGGWLLSAAGRPSGEPARHAQSLPPDRPSGSSRVELRNRSLPLRVPGEGSRATVDVRVRPAVALRDA